jgi:hypothetical protein
MKLVPRTRAAILVTALTVLCLASGATGALPALHRVHDPHRAYSLLLPHDWHYRDVTYVSDHSTDIWWTSRDPLARVVVVLSGCRGCVMTASGAPRPGAALPTSYRKTRLSRDVVAFSGPYEQAEANYEDSGRVFIFRSHGEISGYIRIDVWLSDSNRALAARILSSFKITTH